jgi:hypothetical protein
MRLTRQGISKSALGLTTLESASVWRAEASNRGGEGGKLPRTIPGNTMGGTFQ